MRPCVIEVGRDHADASQDSALSEGLGEDFDVTHAVQDGIDHGFGADGGLHVGYSVIERGRFHA